MNLKSDIRQVEDRMAERRSQARLALDGVTHSVGTRMVSPGTLLAAGLFGAALQRDHRLHGLRMLAMLETANAAMRLLLTLSSRPSR
ncbi:MAG: hypothetical protein ACNA8J_07190 [Gammaproteobacteria bacterium]